jgi:hypothetical protein
VGEAPSAPYLRQVKNRNRLLFRQLFPFMRPFDFRASGDLSTSKQRMTPAIESAFQYPFLFLAGQPEDKEERNARPHSTPVRLPAQGVCVRKRRGGGCRCFRQAGAAGGTDTREQAYPGPLRPVRPACSWLRPSARTSVRDGSDLEYSGAVHVCPTSRAVSDMRGKG